jgi:hypothetical protein
VALYVLHRIHPVTPGIEEARQRSCENNLRQLHQLLASYSRQHGDLPKSTGKSFWLSLRQGDPPLIDEVDAPVLVCPSLQANPNHGPVTYRGPAKNANMLGGSDILGCCKVGDHPGGVIVLRKNGTIVIVKPTSAEQVIAQTAD